MALFDPLKVPFSTRESFLCLSWLEDGLWLRNLRGGDEHTDQGRLLRLEVLERGQPVSPEWSLAPEVLTARTATGSLRLSFDGPERIVLAAEGLGLRLSAGASPYNYAQAAPDHVHVCIARQDLRCEITPHQGRQDLSAPWNGIAADSIRIDLIAQEGALAATLDLFRVTKAPRAELPQAAAAAAARAAFETFHAALPPALPEHAPAHRLAAYILWSGYVPAEGLLTRPAIYMSKNWMTNIWSWDHCFVALALPQDLAWGQMAVIFEAQHASGRLPDYLNDRFALWAFTKPPVHGWTFAQLQPDAHQRQILDWLVRQVTSWRDGPSWHGLPAYRHGNDAGWDNATPFAEGAPVVTPDLATFLILQLDEIARLHDALGAAQAAMLARSQADGLCAALCRELWSGDAFVARRLDGQEVRSGNSLLLLMPLMLGQRLPEAIRQILVQRLTSPVFLTGHGLATEAIDSPLYRPDGYWRGPIWAPTTLLFVDALDRCGQSGPADEIARRYLAMCQENGMAENHDALTGKGQHDPAFAWTSAACLILSHRLYRRARMTSR